MKKILILLSLFMFAACQKTENANNAKTIIENQSNANAVNAVDEQKKKQIEEEANKLKQELDGLQKRVNEARPELENLKREINKTQKEIDETKRKVEKNQKKLN